MLWPVRIHAQPPWRGEQPDRGLYSPMDPRSNCASIKLYSPRMPTDWNCRGQTDPAIQAAVKANRPIKIV